MTEREQKPAYIDGVRITEACIQCRCVDNTVIVCDRTRCLFVAFYHQHRLHSRCDFVTLFCLQLWFVLWPNIS